jgi:hypothetical protein
MGTATDTMMTSRIRELSGRHLAVESVSVVLPTPVIGALPGTTRKSVHKLRRWRVEGLR